MITRIVEMDLPVPVRVIPQATAEELRKTAWLYPHFVSEDDSPTTNNGQPLSKTDWGLFHAVPFQSMNSPAPSSRRGSRRGLQCKGKAHLLRRRS